MTQIIVLLYVYVSDFKCCRCNLVRRYNKTSKGNSIYTCTQRLIVGNDFGPNPVESVSIDGNWTYCNEYLCTYKEYKKRLGYQGFSQIFKIGLSKKIYFLRRFFMFVIRFWPDREVLRFYNVVFFFFIFLFTLFLPKDLSDFYICVQFPVANFV